MTWVRRRGAISPMTLCSAMGHPFLAAPADVEGVGAGRRRAAGPVGAVGAGAGAIRVDRLGLLGLLGVVVVRRLGSGFVQKIREKLRVAGVNQDHVAVEVIVVLRNGDLFAVHVNLEACAVRNASDLFFHVSNSPFGV